MIVEIKNSQDVAEFMYQVIKEGTNIHPDDDFGSIVNIPTGEPVYTEEEAGTRNRLMEECFQVCEESGLDIYDISQEVFLKETGLYKYIPLP